MPPDQKKIVESAYGNKKFQNCFFHFTWSDNWMHIIGNFTTGHFTQTNRQSQIVAYWSATFAAKNMVTMEDRGRPWRKAWSWPELQPEPWWYSPPALRGPSSDIVSTDSRISLVWVSWVHCSGQRWGLANMVFVSTLVLDFGHLWVWVWI